MRWTRVVARGGRSYVHRMADWNPAQYERFKKQRSQPFYDLLGLVRPRKGLRVVDLGCGTGELTREMHLSLGASESGIETVGIDSSDAMLAKAAARAGQGLRFEKGDIATFAPSAPVDLIVSNAAIQWVEDHPKLLARLSAALNPGGQLAVQIPSNDDHRSHIVAAEVAREEPFVTALGGYTRVFPNLTLEGYAASLHRLGFTEQSVRLQVYAHLLDRRDDVVEWVKGTLLTDYEKRVPADLWPAFLARYRERLLPQLEDTKPYYYPFKRIFFWGIK
jgi:trans-aconitate 2-methyltransferase